MNTQHARTRSTTLKVLCFSFLLLALSLFGASAQGQQVAQETDTFTFAVIGDVRPAYAEGSDPIGMNPEFLDMIDELNLLDPDFVVIPGDLIQGYQEDATVVEKMWDSFDKALGKLTVPYYLVVGNHDVWDKQSEKIYQKRYGDLYYSLDHKGSHFIVLNSESTEALSRIAGNQLEWLRSNLEAHRDAKQTFVFLHKPLWDEPGKRELWERDVHPILSEYGVDVVFAGHVHRYEKSPTIDGVRYIITGGGGAERGDAEVLGGFPHYVLATVRGRNTTLAVVKKDSVVSEDAVTADFTKALFTIRSTLRFGKVTVAAEGAVDETLRVTLTNPLSEPLGIGVNWTTPLERRWWVEPQEILVELAPGETRDLVFRIRGHSDSLLPPPTYQTSLTIGGETMPLESLVLPVSTATHLVCAKAKSPITVDGTLDESAWAEAQEVTGFVLLDGSNVASQQTAVRVLYDSQNLYVAMTCFESQMEDVQANIVKRDGSLWADDCVEVFIAPSEKPIPYYHFIVNSAGVRFDEVIWTQRMDQDSGWDAVWEAQASRGNDSFIVEMAVPFESLGSAVPKPGTVWRINFCRGRQVEPKEFSCWSCTFGGFHNPQAFDKIHFAP